MAHWAAIDWDQSEARAVVADVQRGKLRIAALGSAPIDPPPDGQSHSPEQIGAALRAALGDAKTARGGVLVGVDRASIELLYLTLPPAHDDELPQLARNQAMSVSAAVDDDAAVDFVPLSDDAGVVRPVVVAALPRQAVERICAACKAAGLVPRKLLLRPYAAASLLGRSHATRPATLLVSPVADEVDLVVLSGDRVVYWRTVRLPREGDPQAAAAQLAVEVARTVAVEAEIRPDGPPVQEVVIFGAEGEHDRLLRAVRGELKLPARVVDPLAGLATDAAEIPPGAGRFAALVGMLAEEADGRRPAIDFLHPRQAPKPPNRRRALAIGAALAALVVAGLVWAARDKLATLDAENAKQSSRLKQLETQLDRVAGRRQVARALQDWNAGNIVWLDELRELAVKLPGMGDSSLDRLAMNQRGAGGQIDLHGVVRDASLVAQMERRLRDERHVIHSHTMQERERAEGKDWQFESSILVAPRDSRTQTAPAEPRSAAP